ncbi:MAG: hypothetical protein LM571_00765 [Desulfurococcaceae archaeon]|jgi:hypothetical protein|nr:hypothetical protein [Desulfurococcaceae archaeon]
MFIDVRGVRLPRDLRYFWIPQVLIRPACRSNLVLVDCYFSKHLGKRSLTLLLSRRLRKVPNLVTAAPVESPVLYSDGCNVLHYVETITYLGDRIECGDISDMLLRPHDARSGRLILELSKTMLKLLCYPEPPLEFNQVYVLIALDVKRKQSYYIIGNRLIRSAVLEEVIYGNLGGIKLFE